MDRIQQCTLTSSSSLVASVLLYMYVCFPYSVLDFSFAPYIPGRRSQTAVSWASMYMTRSCRTEGGIIRPCCGPELDCGWLGWHVHRAERSIGARGSTRCGYKAIDAPPGLLLSSYTVYQLDFVPGEHATQAPKYSFRRARLLSIAPKLISTLP